MVLTNFYQKINLQNLKILGTTFVRIIEVKIQDIYEII